MQMTNGKYYWLKLKRDFFKRHDIRIIESMPNGKDYILFYLKLLCESVDHEGRLRFSDQVPYNTEMLAVITDTNKDTVAAAVKMFTELGMMEILDDGTLYMTECERMIGSAASNDHALRQARYRERQKLLITENVTERHADVTKNDESKSKSKREKNIYSDFDLEEWDTDGTFCPTKDKEEASLEQEKKSNTKEKNSTLEEEKETLSTKIERLPLIDYGTDFEEAWQMYPRKEGKMNAKRDYIKARKEGVTKEEILDGIRRYKAATANTEPQYILHGSTWFHQRRWTDEFIVNPKRSHEREFDASAYEGVYEE